MYTLQILLNGVVLGCLYACIAAGFSLVWGVLNVINLMHGSFIVLGSYLAWGAYNSLGINPLISLAIAAPVFYGLGYLIQRGILNRVIAAPVLVTLTLTFGLDLMLNNAMILAFRADYRQLILDPPLGTIAGRQNSRHGVCTGAHRCALPDSAQVAGGSGNHLGPS